MVKPKDRPSETEPKGEATGGAAPASPDQLSDPRFRAFQLPSPWPEDLRPQIRAWLAGQPDHKLVVLDDDPTGTQTVHDVPVLTSWEVDTLRREFATPGSCFFILTNSRSLPPSAARSLTAEIACNLRQAAHRGQYTLVSRSDSTLRGHYPLETDVLAEELGPFDATILIPYFEAGGRYTINDTHYVADGDDLIPAAETPFARDPAFGYRSSNLCAWVEEKTAGRVQAEAVASFSIADLRTRAESHEPTRRVFSKLLGLRRGATAIVNACAPSDLEFFAAATLRAEKAGGRYLFRTAAQFVSARLGLEPRPLWQPQRLADRCSARTTGGLVVVGSHVPKTTAQLHHLLNHRDVTPVELPASLVQDKDAAAAALRTVTKVVTDLLCAGRDVVLFTSRTLLAGADPEESLRIGQRISAALVAIVAGLPQPPRFLIAKGGITSSDLATRALGVRRAMVCGQILPGIPVWELGPESRFPGLHYVVFPGNVGGSDALSLVVQSTAYTA